MGRYKLASRTLATFLVLAGVSTLTAHASTLAGLNLGSGDLDTIVKSNLGINTPFSFDSLLGALIKYGGAYTMVHSVFELHDAWKQRQYQAKDFLHLLIGAGGTGIAVGGVAMFASQFIGSGSGALLP